MSKKKTLASKDSTVSEKPNTTQVKRATTSAANNEKKNHAVHFSLDDVASIVAQKKVVEPTEQPKKPASKTPEPVKSAAHIESNPTEKRVHVAASLSDILGFNPAAKKSSVALEADEIPDKWKHYYDLLIDLRKHLNDELDLHTADTLKHSSREESGTQGGGFGNHQADAATDAFDRDFALSLVSSEQDALYEVEEAIQRIKLGEYGLCEVTGEPIAAERLEAVPFTRFSLEGQAEYEKKNRRKVARDAGGIFDDNGDAPKLESSDDD
jgi:RNA polymerase-binding transcription factor DksA